MVEPGTGIAWCSSAHAFPRLGTILKNLTSQGAGLSMAHGRLPHSCGATGPTAALMIRRGCTGGLRPVRHLDYGKSQLGAGNLRSGANNQLRGRSRCNASPAVGAVFVIRQSAVFQSALHVFSVFVVGACTIMGNALISTMFSHGLIRAPIWCLVPYALMHRCTCTLSRRSGLHIQMDYGHTR